MSNPDLIQKTTAGFVAVFGSAPALLTFDEANERAKSDRYRWTKDLEADPEALAAWSSTAFVDAGECLRWLRSLSPELRAEAVLGEWVFGWFVEDDPREQADPDGEFCSSLSVSDVEDPEDLAGAVEDASRFGCLFVEVRPAR